VHDLVTNLVHLDLYSRNGDLSQRLAPAEVKFLWNLYQTRRFGSALLDYSDAEQAFLVAVAHCEGLPLARFMSTLAKNGLPTHFRDAHQSGRFAGAGFDLFMADHLLHSRASGGITAPLAAETLDWLLEPDAGGNQGVALPRLALARHAGSADLQQSHDLATPQGRLALLGWFCLRHWPTLGLGHYPEREARAAHANGLAVPDAATPAAAMNGSASVRPAVDSELPTIGPLARDGANLIGWVKTPIGIGVDVRLAAQAFRSAAIPYCIIDAARRLPPPVAQIDCGESDAIVPGPRYETDVVFLDTATQFRFFAFDLLNGTRRRARTIGVCPWELPAWPDEVRFTTSTIDTFWAATRYIRDAFERHFPQGRVRLAPPCVVVDGSVRRSPPALTQGRKFRFLTVFDGLSSLHRKNPLAVAQAFTRAFGNRDDVELVVKAMHLKPPARGYDEFMRAVAADERITLVVATLDQRDVWEMVAQAHCVVSLHRSEGFGRNIAEAMLLERPVICSAFSGSLDFTSEDTAFLVGGEEIEVGRHQYAMSLGQTWFDASIDHAAELMRKVVDDYDGALAMAHRGRAYIEEHHSIAAAGRRYAALLAQDA
jgi:glycosyltransferase involved in cell wall biosynthesis